MQEKDIQHILGKGKRVTLSNEKKALIRTRLSEYADFHPIPQSGAMQGNGERYFGLFSVPQLFGKRALSAMMLFVLVFVGGGTSYAAEGALPGDALYPVKVVVNEGIRSVVTVSTEGEAEWNARLAERRLEEVEKLSAEGGVDAEIEKELLERFEVHVTQAQAEAQKLSQDGKHEAALAVSSNLEARLNAHVDIIASLAPEDAVVAVALKETADVAEGAAESENAAVLSVAAVVEPEEAPQEPALLDRVRMSAESASRARVAAEVEISLRADISAESKIKAAEGFIKRATAYIEKHAEEVPQSDAYTRVQGRIEIAEKLLADARIELGRGNNGEAYRLAQEAQRVATEAHIFIKNKNLIDGVKKADADMPDNAETVLDEHSQVSLPDDTGDVQDGFVGEVETDDPPVREEVAPEDDIDADVLENGSLEGTVEIRL